MNQLIAYIVIVLFDILFISLISKLSFIILDKYLSFLFIKLRSPSILWKIRLLRLTIMDYTPILQGSLRRTKYGAL